jgi:hypothetical protein
MYSQTKRKNRAAKLSRHVSCAAGSTGIDAFIEVDNEKENPMLLLIIVLVLLFGGGGGYYGYSRWGTGGGMGILGTVLLIVVVMYLLGALRI